MGWIKLLTYKCVRSTCQCTSFSSSQYKVNENMSIITIVLVVVCIQSVIPGAIDAPESQDTSWVSDSSEALSVEEKMKELRIRMVKFQILSKLNMKGEPSQVEPPSEASREVIRLLLQEEDGADGQQTQNPRFDSQERLIIHAKGNGLPCLQSNGSYCKLFRYELSPTLNTSSMNIWIYKLTDFPKWVSISLTFSSSNEEKYYDILYYDLNQVGWNKLQLPRILLPPTWNDSVFYSVEITGQNIEVRGDRRPFLMVSKLFFMSSRQRRDISCNTNESCCLKPLRVSFAEIGFNWVLYPDELEANMCTGRCSMDQSSLRTHYERAMAEVLERDSSLHSTLGECMALCCKPKILEPVRVIYNDTDGIIHVQKIPNLSVKSCSCS